MSRPTVDYKGRRRSKTIAFRVSPEEDEVINALVAASGMTKQDYITSRLECRDINVSPNVRVYRMLRDQMRSVYVELRRLRSADGIDERLIELMQVLTRVFIDLGADELGAVGDVELLHFTGQFSEGLGNDEKGGPSWRTPSIPGTSTRRSSARSFSSTTTERR